MLRARYDLPLNRSTFHLSDSFFWGHDDIDLGLLCYSGVGDHELPWNIRNPRRINRRIRLKLCVQFDHLVYSLVLVARIVAWSRFVDARLFLGDREAYPVLVLFDVWRIALGV